MQYHRPQSLVELFDLMEEIPSGERTLLAGGTDLMPRYEAGRPYPQQLIDLKHIPDIIGITEQDGAVEIGALTTVETLKQDSFIRTNFPALWEATVPFAGVHIRHRATLGGNIANASPAGDTLPPLYAYRAKLRVIGPDQERMVTMSEFIVGPGQLAIKSNEIIHSIILPKHDGFSTFYKLGLRQAMAISVVNFAISGQWNHSGFAEVIIAAGAVAPTVVYLEQFSTALMKNSDEIDEIIALIDEDIAPIDDLRATARYRKKALKNVLAFTLKELMS